MRALVGAILAAGSLIGLGLASIGVGIRYAAVRDTDGKFIAVPLHEVDKALLVVLVFLALSALIGMTVAFLGLAYHHHRRHIELLRNHHSGVSNATAPRIVT